MASSDMAHPYVWRDSFTRVTGLMHMCGMTHSYLWHASSVCVVEYQDFTTWDKLYLGFMENFWFRYVKATPYTWSICLVHDLYVSHHPLICLSWPLNMSDLTHSYVCHNSFTCVRWTIHLYLECMESFWLVYRDISLWKITVHICDMTHSYVLGVYENPLVSVCHANTCDMPHLYIWHDLFMYVTWPMYMSDMTHSYVWEDSFVYIWGVWKASDLGMPSQFLWHDKSIFLTWPIYVSDMTHQYDWHDSSMCLTWRIHYMCEMAHSRIRGVGGKLLNSVFRVSTCDITHLYVWHDAFRRVTWPINMSHKTHLYVWNNSFRYIWGIWKASQFGISSQYLWHKPSICHTCDIIHLYVIPVTWPIYMSYLWHNPSICLYVWYRALTPVTWPITMSHMTHPYVSHDSSIRVGWPIHVHLGHMEGFWCRSIHIWKVWHI